MNIQSPFNLKKLADNGLRRGYTTGSCATAAVKAALVLLEYGEIVEDIDITLPDQIHYLKLPVENVQKISPDCAEASVIKFAGDDPDQTDGCTISAQVKKTRSGKIVFLAGRGIGIVSQPGIRVPIGEPAINPGPREMIKIAIEEICGSINDTGFDITISCHNGQEIAKKTFNPRLGIVGGISILGTTGIVEPMSLAAYMASIEVYVRVALADNASAVAFLPGNIGIRFATDILGLQNKYRVHIANFLGFALEACQKYLEENNIVLENLWILGHPGKLAKVLSDQWDTSSRSSGMAMDVLAKLAAELSLPVFIQEQIQAANTVEAVTDILSNQNIDNNMSQFFWAEVENRLTHLMEIKVPRVNRVRVKLFRMDGKALNN